MACDKCGSKRGHMPGCEKWGQPTGKKFKRGPTVKRGEQIPRQGQNPYGKKCPPHNPSAVKKGPKGTDTMWYKCTKCDRHLGRW